MSYDGMVPATGPARCHAVFKAIERALLGVPKTATAEEVNLRLAAQGVYESLTREGDTGPEPLVSYSYYRACVRAILRERADWCRWEGKSAQGVVAPRRYRKHREEAGAT